MTYKPKNTNERILHRLKITRGHLNRVIEMVENGTYCIDVLHQSGAVQRGLQEIDNLVMEHHLNHCAKDAIKSGDGYRAIEEVMNVFRRKNG